MKKEAGIIAECKRNKASAQKKVYEHYAPLFKGICLRYASDEHEAEDILQEGFIKIFLNIKKYNNKGSFEGWMKKVLVNTAINSIRKKDKNNKVDIADIDQSQIGVSHEEAENMGGAELDREDIGDGVDYSYIEQAQLSREDLIESLQELPPPFRTVFNLHVMEGKKHKEIAQMLDIPEKTSRTRLIRARKQLQKIVYEKSIKQIAR